MGKKQRLRSLLVRGGNQKLGQVFAFSIPAGKTCPGATPLCLSTCYVRRKQSHFTLPSVKISYAWRYKATRSPTFVPRMIAEFARCKPGTLFRLHVSGDLYSLEYADKWVEILRVATHVTCWCYTRSHAISEIVPALVRLAALPNVQLWMSADRETGVPYPIPGTRVAYMQVAADDVPDYHVDLVFRDHALRKTVAKRVAGAVVCPAENGVVVPQKITCDRCGICYTAAASKRTSAAGRLALPVLGG